MITKKKTDFYSLYKDRNGDWILEVLCGGFAMFCRRLKLNAEEIKTIEEWGEYYVEKIALDIAKEPSLFNNRVEEE